MEAAPRIHIRPRDAWAMVWRYARSRLTEQCRAVAFILLYLVGFQVLILQTLPFQAVRLAFGIGLVVLGLAAFLEGLFLGIMPLGEQVGLDVPRRRGIVAITFLGLLVGLGSTLAEPAVAALRVAGEAVRAWDAPLLYRLLESEPEKLVWSIAAGVGVAVAVGMLRFAFGWSVKLMAALLAPLLAGVTLWATRDPLLSPVLGLAWDAGAVTTGAVTVPLVLALGMGVSRAFGKQEDTADGFGVVMLASALPVLGVLALGWGLRASTPSPVPADVFFSPAFRTEAVRLMGTEERLERHAFQRGDAAARLAFYGDPDLARAAVQSLSTGEPRRRLLGDMGLAEWLGNRASPEERAWLHGLRGTLERDTGGAPLWTILRAESVSAVRAVLPLITLLLLALLIVVRRRPRHRDEVVLGILLALVGMALLTTGIRVGLVPLGDQAGRPLPSLFRNAPREVERVLLEEFDPGAVQSAVTPEGGETRFFFLADRRNVPRPVPFDPDRWDPEAGRYEHVVVRRPLFGGVLTATGLLLVLVFAFGLGFGSTLAEPALHALGRTVEELTVGTVRRAGLVRAVSIGVGLGVLLGVVRILYGIPLVWLVAPPYLLLLPLTLWSREDFAGVAWDCGGVTTGVITVPLVLAMGLGIGEEVRASDGFGVLALASVYPIVCVLVYGLFVDAQQRRSLRAAGEDTNDA